MVAPVTAVEVIVGARLAGGVGAPPPPPPETPSEKVVDKPLKAIKGVCLVPGTYQSNLSMVSVVLCFPQPASSTRIT